MTHSAIRRPTLLVSVAGLVLLSACSGSTTAAPDSATATATSRADIVNAQLPVDAYLGELASLDDADIVAEQTAIEESIARCMSAEGFEYTVPDVAAMYSDEIHGSPEDQESREWISTNGYGVTENPGGSPADDLPPDPNFEYAQTLSAPSWAAYHKALVGILARTDISEEDIMASPLEEQGCRGRAQLEVLGTNVWKEPQFASLKDAYDALLTATAGSVEVADANASWADCMADAGYAGLSEPTDAIVIVSTANDEAWDAVDTSSDPDARPAPDVLAELKALDVATALADLTCKETTGYDTAVRDVRFAAEEQFVTDHKAELDALLAASEQ